MMTSTFTAHVAAALAMGTAIGLERQWRQHTAGLRTNALVAIGAAMFVGLSTLMDGDSSPSRIAAQVVSGLGFLGGGVILREGLNVRGLNTAATLWCSGAVGSLSGAGFVGEAAVGTCAVLLVHLGLRPVVRRMEKYTSKATDIESFYRLRIECDADQDMRVRQVLLRHVNGHEKLSLQGLSTEDTDLDRTIVLAEIFSCDRNDRAVEEVVTRVGIEPEIKAISWQRSAA